METTKPNPTAKPTKPSSTKAKKVASASPTKSSKKRTKPPAGEVAAHIFSVVFPRGR